MYFKEKPTMEELQHHRILLCPRRKPVSYTAKHVTHTQVFPILQKIGSNLQGLWNLSHLSQTTTERYRILFLRLFTFDIPCLQVQSQK